MTSLRGKAPAKIVNMLEHDSRGSILLVTSKGIYLELEGKVLLLCPEKYGVIPVGISLEDYGRLLLLRPEAGQRISCRAGILKFPGGSAEILPEICQPRACREEPVPEALEAAALELRKKGGSRGLAPLVAPLILRQKEENPDPWCRAALPALTELEAGLKANEPQQAIRGGIALLGLGTGLTPSGDDVLCGLFYVLLRSKWRRRESLLALMEAVKEKAPFATNRISAAYLKAIAENAPYGRMDAMWAILTGETCGSIRILTEIGSSSGGDMLLGMLLAGSLLDPKEECGVG